MTTRKPLKKKVRLLEGEAGGGESEGMSAEEEQELRNNSSKSLVESNKSDSKSSLKRSRRLRSGRGSTNSTECKGEEEVKSKRVSDSWSQDIVLRPLF